MRITTRDECRSILDRIIDFYNTQRPHMSIGMQTPEAVHMQTGGSGGAGKIAGPWDKMKKGIYLSECPGAAVPRHLDKTNRSDCSTVNQNSDSVKTFRDKKHRL